MESNYGASTIPSAARKIFSFISQYFAHFQLFYEYAGKSNQIDY